jgi:PadR family transcriptional regulator PadR
MDMDAWKTQLRKGAAELAVLSLLEGGEKYGVEMLEAFRARPEIGIADSTIYPLLNRMEKEGRLKSRWAPDLGSGPPRKYYHLTKDGESALEEMRPAWRAFQAQLSELVGK